jgi:hypothetical protein
VFEPRAHQRGAVTESVLCHQVVEAFDFVIGQSKPHVARRGFISARRSGHSSGFTSFVVPFNETGRFFLLTPRFRREKVENLSKRNRSTRLHLWSVSTHRGINQSTWVEGFDEISNSTGERRKIGACGRTFAHTDSLRGSVDDEQRVQRTARTPHFAKEMGDSRGQFSA